MRLATLCLIATTALGAPLVGCGSSTSVKDTWKEPGVSRLQFRKILVIAASPDETFRHKAEDRMAREIKGAQVIKSYTVIPEREDLLDRANVDRVVAEQGIDGIIMMRVVSKETEIDYIPGSYPSSYYGFWTYYGPYYGLSPYYSGDVRTTQVIAVETNIYEAAQGRLLWSGLTKSRDADNTEELVDETVEAVRDRLREEKLIR